MYKTTHFLNLSGTSGRFILFMYDGTKQEDTEYSFILISNRDEFYDRPAKDAAPWDEDPEVIGGRDMKADCAGGTWLAFSPTKKKIALLLNLPNNRDNKENLKSRGKIVEDYVKSNDSVRDYVENTADYTKNCSDFSFVAVNFSKSKNEISLYSNVSKELKSWSGKCLGFSNSLPETPLLKVTAGQAMLAKACETYKKIEQKEQLVEELVNILRCKDKHLPHPYFYHDMNEELSPIYVCIPTLRYGTRTHSILIVTKDGHVEFIELTMQAPIDPLNPVWKKNQFDFVLC